MYDQLRRDWVARFTTLSPENHPRAKSGISSVTSSSLPMVWALQKPRAGGTRYSSQVKEYLKARFDVGEESGCKADPEQFATDMRNARNKDNVRLFSREEWLLRNQIQVYFSRLSVLKRKQGSSSTPPQVAQDDMDDVVGSGGGVKRKSGYSRWLRCMINYQSSIQYSFYYDSHNLCDLCQTQKLDSFNVEMLKSICSHFEISFKSKDRKHQLIENWPQ